MTVLSCHERRRPLYYEPFIMILRRRRAASVRSLPRRYLILEGTPSPSPRTPSLYAAVSNFAVAALGFYVSSNASNASPFQCFSLSPRVFLRVLRSAAMFHCLAKKVRAKSAPIPPADELVIRVTRTTVSEALPIAYLWPGHSFATITRLIRRNKEGRVK